jgi:hypothetical protein
MILAVLYLLAAVALSVGVGDAVIESASTDPLQIVVFGRVLLEPGTPEGIWILCGMSAVAALALVSAVARIRGRRLERRLAAELDARYAEMSSKAAGDAARAHLLDARVAELQTWYERAVAERDEARRELESAQAQLTAALSKPKPDDEVIVLPTEAEGAEDERAAQVGQRYGDASR